jgi:inorganic pyrophosphatase
MNPWHDVALGDDIERHFRCVIEIPKGSKIKYELDKATGLLWLDRVLHSAVHYPANYGFLPQTYCDDGDPLDVLVLGQEPVVPLCVLRAKAIGVITMRDDKGQDDKIIAVHVDDPEYAPYRDVSELPPHRLKEMQRFFLDYKVLEDKSVDIDQIRGRADAQKVIRDAMELYRRRILPGLPPRCAARPGAGELPAAGPRAACLGCACLRGRKNAGFMWSEAGRGPSAS